MNRKKWKGLFILAAFFSFFVIIVGCGSKDEKTTVAKPVMAPGPAISIEPAAPQVTTVVSPAAAPAVALPKGIVQGIIVEIDGIKLTNKQLDAEMKKKFETIKGQIPAESLDQVKTDLRKGLIDEFVVRTLLTKEIGKKNIAVTEKEITDILEDMKAQLPAGMKIEDLLKKNNIDVSKIREEIALNIKINKLILQDLGEKAKITDKEIIDFYNGNPDKFNQPESVHARHILVAKAPGDTEKIKTDKKAKAEELKVQLEAGTDFAELAAKNLHCPSKQSGGDLGSFSRGQMVKPFEDAAFSQEKNAIGPVVETDFGFHVIQVLEHQSAKVIKLDGETKKLITAFIKRKKQEETFNRLVKNLKAGADIVVYGK